MARPAIYRRLAIRTIWLINAIKLLTNESCIGSSVKHVFFRARNQFGNELITSEYERIYYKVLGIEADIPVPICE